MAMFSGLVTALMVLCAIVSVIGTSDESLDSSSVEKRDADDSDVIKLTDSNFKDKVLGSSEPWLVEFYAPWCGYCKKLAPHWAKAATELKGRMKLGALDATKYTTTAGKYDVNGYPTIKYFSAGKKSGKAEEYDGGQITKEIVEWAKAKIK